MGAIYAVVAGALCNFALLPAVSGFVPLAFIVGVFMISAGVAVCHPRTATIGSGFAVYFWTFIWPVNGMRIDDVTFLNSALATLFGIGFSTVVFAILFPMYPETIRSRLNLAALRDLSAIAHGPDVRGAEAWLLRTADRLHRLLVSGSTTPQALRESDLRGQLAVWSIGDSLFALKELGKKHAAVQRPLSALLARLHRLEIGRVERACCMATTRLNRHGRLLNGKARREVLRGAILLQTIADTVNAHGAFLRSGLPMQHDMRSLGT